MGHLEGTSPQNFTVSLPVLGVPSHAAGSSLCVFFGDLPTSVAMPPHSRHGTPASSVPALAGVRLVPGFCTLGSLPLVPVLGGDEGLRGEGLRDVSYGAGVTSWSSAFCMALEEMEISQLISALA